MRDLALIAGKELERLMPSLSRDLFRSRPDPLISLSLAQMRLIRLLDESEVTVSHAAELLGSTCSAVTQMANRLELMGYVHRSVSHEDQRRRILGLSPKGRDMLGARKRMRVERAAELLQVLPEGKLHDFVEALRFLSKALKSQQSAAIDGSGMEEFEAVGAEMRGEPR